MGALPFIAFYPSDWLAGTRGLSATETGVYITLVAMMYEREAPLDMEDARLARLCGTTLAAFRAALETLISERKIKRSAGRLWNDRVDKELKKRAERSDSSRASANVRWKKDKQKQSRGDANAMQPQCARDANQNHNHIREEDTNVSLSGRPDDIPHASPASEAVAAYNTAAERIGWPRIQRMTPQRTRSLRARLADCGGVEGWQVALRRAMDSDFLCGRTSKPWTGCGFDWLIKAQNFTKLMEGNYDNRNHNEKPANGRAHRPDAALEQIARLAGLGPAPGYGRA
jgi:uncharacterized protein YdaU (DUF1376 family)